MAGKPGRSGPPGNLNSSRNPWRSFWRRRALRPDQRWLLPVLDGYQEQLLVDKPDCTAAERRLMELASTARGCTLLILDQVQRRGLLRPLDGTSNWDLSTGAKELKQFMSLERQLLQALGTERRQRNVTNLTAAQYAALVPADTISVLPVPAPEDDDEPT